MAEWFKMEDNLMNTPDSALWLNAGASKTRAATEEQFYEALVKSLLMSYQQACHTLPSLDQLAQEQRRQLTSKVQVQACRHWLEHRQPALDQQIDPALQIERSVRDFLQAWLVAHVICAVDSIDVTRHDTRISIEVDFQIPYETWKNDEYDALLDALLDLERPGVRIIPHAYPSGEACVS